MIVDKFMDMPTMTEQACSTSSLPDTTLGSGLPKQGISISNSDDIHDNKYEGARQENLDLQVVANNQTSSSDYTPRETASRVSINDSKALGMGVGQAYCDGNNSISTRQGIEVQFDGLIDESRMPNRGDHRRIKSARGGSRAGSFFHSFSKKKHNRALSDGHTLGGGSAGNSFDCGSSSAGSSCNLNKMLQMLEEEEDVSRPSKNDEWDTFTTETENSATDKKLPRRWVPKSRSARRLKNTGLLSSFTRSITKGGVKGVECAHNSSHPGHLTGLLEEGDQGDLRRNSDHSMELTEAIQDNFGGHSASATQVAEMLQQHIPMTTLTSVPSGGAAEGCHGTRDQAVTRYQRMSSNLSSFSLGDDDLHLDNELDMNMKSMDSQTMLDNLGDSATPDQLANIAAMRANEYIEECLSANVELLDRATWESIPQYAKKDLIVKQHLGKGSFSDAFEVIAMLEDEVEKHTLKSLGDDGKDLDQMIENKFHNSMALNKRTSAMSGTLKRPSLVEEGDELEGSDLKDRVMPLEGIGDDLDKEIDAMFGGGGMNLSESAVSVDSLDKEIDNMFGECYKPTETKRPCLASLNSSFNGKPTDLSSPAYNPTKQGSLKPEEEFNPQSIKAPSKGIQKQTSFQQPRTRSSSIRRRNTSDLGASVCMGSHARGTTRKQTRKVILAMKCLRPQIRSDAEQFIIGVEDLVHETAMLASLNHPNIIKLHGRAGGCVSNTFRLSDGYFILLDRLKDTLDDRIKRWKKSTDKRAPPSLLQIKTAHSVADAISYLHAKRIVFRDLKPANVGFDTHGILKLFDFGFAIGIEEARAASSLGHSEDSGDIERHPSLLYDKAGTPRYMAPEVGLEKGYSLPADVYSFGILLWEICSLKKPFGNVKSADEFHKKVFEKGARPTLDKYWPEHIKETMVKCWSGYPAERPVMQEVKSILAAHTKELSLSENQGENQFRKSSVFRRFTG